MSKKKEHMAEPSKISVFRSFEEMKSSPVSFPSDKPLIELQAEYKELIARLRSASSAEKDRREKPIKRKQ
jgi:hypothetical protein